MKRDFRNSYFEEDILLVLGSYEDIFSDFDPRPHSQKSISGDFLLECKKASLDKGRVNLKLFLPSKKRRLKEEVKIKRRLREHFKRHCKEKKKEIRKIRLSGFFWTILGSIMMVISALFFSNPTSFLPRLLAILAQPAGWFFLWEGLAKILITSKEKMPDYLFYKKMANSGISFLNE